MRNSIVELANGFDMRPQRRRGVCAASPGLEYPLGEETDRIRTVADNLRRMGVEAEELPEGLVVPGRQKFRAAQLDSFGDHRIAMAFAVAALTADGPCTIQGSESAGVSFPEFFATLQQIAKQ